MKKIPLQKKLFATAIAFTILCPYAIPTYADDAQAPVNKTNITEREHKPKEIVVKFKDSDENKLVNSTSSVTIELNKGLDDTNAKVTEVKKLQESDVSLIKLDKDVNISDAIADLENTFPNEIEYAEPNYVFSISDVKTNWVPTEYNYDLLWGLKNDGVFGTAGIDINAEAAWNITRGNNTVTVAVIDTGVDIRHPDLDANIFVNKKEIANNKKDDDNNGYIDDVNGWNSLGNNGNVTDENGHGTHVSGTIAAEANGKGAVGVAPNVKVLPVKIFDATGKNATLADTIEAIQYCKKMGIKVINCSWGGFDYSQALYDAMKNTPALFVCAAGNASTNIEQFVHYPASFDLPNIVSVASIDSHGKLSWFSNYGITSVDLAAPGSEIFSTTPGNTYSEYSGTSMAAPHVAGVAALMLSKNTNLNTNTIKSTILNNTSKLNTLKDVVFTGGMLNAYNSLSPVSGPRTSVRLGGADRIKTSLKIADTIRGSEKLNAVILAPANDFPDALSGNILNTKYNAPTLLTGKTAQGSKATLDYINANVNKSATIILLGGEGVIDNSIISNLKSKGYSKFKRLGGKDRFATNRAIVRDFAPAQGTPIILTSANSFADALSISSISASKGYPIIMVDPTVTAETKELITSLRPSEIIITGGRGAVSFAVEDYAETITPKITRIGGSDRFETSLMIFNHFNDVNNPNAVVASGLDFPDALSGSYLGAKHGSPILLVGPSNTELQRNAMQNNRKSNFYILGGDRVITPTMVNNLSL